MAFDRNAYRRERRARKKLAADLDEGEDEDALVSSDKDAGTLDDTKRAAPSGSMAAAIEKLLRKRARAAEPSDHAVVVTAINSDGTRHLIGIPLHKLADEELRMIQDGRWPWQMDKNGVSRRLIDD